jgi:telomerase reverse transcriptase
VASNAPIDRLVDPTSLESPEIADLATPGTAVSAFVRSAISRLIPTEAWGTGDIGKSNASWFLLNVDNFVQRRKFESMTLHEIIQGLKISAMTWLTPPGGQNKMAKSDFEKRKQLLAEFIYYLIDSFVIPLIRSNFHVTESSSSKNRLFYFRHDVWRKLTEPAMARLKTSMLQDMGSKLAKSRTSGSSLGFSQIRLLPKKTDFRPIANLRKRSEYIHYGKRLLGQSINSKLNPVFRVLNYEKVRSRRNIKDQSTKSHQERHLSRLGSSLFSVGGIHAALKDYRDKLVEHNLDRSPRYFAKVDVQSCFDTIPQEKVMSLVASLVSAGQYAISNHAEVGKPRMMAHRKGVSVLKPRVKFLAEGHSAKKLSRVEKEAEDKIGQDRKNTIFVGAIGQRIKNRDAILNLLNEHIGSNTVKIGRKFYRQKNGIPQGSIVSTLLCNLFYGQLEQDNLSFIKTPGTVLLRLIDDFLLISTDKAIAIRFLEVMHKSIPEYGIAVKTEKSLVNFGVDIDKQAVPLISARAFPYCGVLIDTMDFNITKDMARAGPGGMGRTQISHHGRP